MRISLYIIVMAILGVGFSSSALALDVRPEVDLQQPPETYQSETLTFQYEDGQVITHQAFHTENGKVEQVTVHFEDEGAKEHRDDAFLSVQIYDRAPTIQGVTDPREALQSALIHSLSERLGETLKPESMRANFGGLGEVSGVQMMTTKLKTRRYLAFFVKPLDAGGYAVVFMQLRADDGATRNQILTILKSMSFGGA